MTTVVLSFKKVFTKVSLYSIYGCPVCLYNTCAIRSLSLLPRQQLIFGSFFTSDWLIEYCIPWKQALIVLCAKNLSALNNSYLLPNVSDHCKVI